MLNATKPAHFAFFLFFFLTIRASTHTKQHERMDVVCAVGFFNHMIITGCDWLVIHVEVMVIIFIYYFVQPFAVIGFIRCVTICRVGLYLDFYKITV